MDKVKDEKSEKNGEKETQKINFLIAVVVEK